MISPPVFSATWSPSSSASGQLVMTYVGIVASSIQAVAQYWSGDGCTPLAWMTIGCPTTALAGAEMSIV